MSVAAWILEAIAALLAFELVLVGLAFLAARRIERIAPPQGRLVEIGAARLHLVEAGAGPPVVLIHGLAGQIGHFAHSLVPRLERDFRVIAVDRPGSGYSPPTPGGIAGQAAILARAIEALGLGRPLVVGHSLGGAVALALALDHPDCVGGLALIAPATHPVARAPALFRALVIRSPALRALVAWTTAGPAALLAGPVFFRAAFAPETAPADFGRAGGLLALRPRNIVATSAELTAGLADATLKAMPARYAGLTIPVGVLFGRDDRVLDWRAQGEAMARALPALDFELVDGGHMLPVTQPELCARFIRRIAARTPAA